ncbi:MAG TPA: carbon monoxide dehydrogenase accessory protein CooC [Syntrophorhabdaceae bacterium]|nr:carbon monoxide dehydrogenase accessory protein CooC [Syntrophorhabdaceae bacterium]
MKIAVSGKGGVGKTTLAAVMARILAERGNKVIAVDADPDSNLASALGIEEIDVRKTTPLAQMQEFIEERTGTKKGEYGAFFQINPKVDDIPERFSICKNGVKLIMLGSIPQGGGGCFCPESALLRNFLAHVLIERDDYVIVDMEAGLEHLGRGTTSYIDALIVVVEPGKRSIQTAFQIRKLGLDLGIERIYAVSNKIIDSGDESFMNEQLCGFSFLGSMKYNKKILEADQRGISPYETCPELRLEVRQVIDRLQNTLSADGR